jgi:hypothetical protein
VKKKRKRKKERKKNKHEQEKLSNLKLFLSNHVIAVIPFQPYDVIMTTTGTAHAPSIIDGRVHVHVMFKNNG